MKKYLKERTEASPYGAPLYRYGTYDQTSSQILYAPEKACQEQTKLIF
jgi:hypothetical protein